MGEVGRDDGGLCVCVCVCVCVRERAELVSVLIVDASEPVELLLQKAKLC